MSTRILHAPSVGLFALLAPSLVAKNFGPERELAHPASYALTSFAGDLDGDGDLDVAYGGHTTLAWYENLGPAGFSGARILDVEPLGLTVSGYSSVTGGDLDGDGDLDLAACSFLGKTLAWFENEGGGEFGPAQVLLGTSTAPYEVLAADLDGDGDLELALASALSKDVRVFDNLGGGSFAPHQVVSTIADSYYALAGADMDADGDVDLVAGGFEKIAYLENLGGGSFAPTAIAEATSATNMGVALVDLDGDGQRDIAAASSVGGDVGWYRNLGGGAFGAKVVVGSGFQNPSAIQGGDLDGDGDAELVACTEGGEVVRFENQGAGVFGAAQLVSDATEVTKDVDLADLDDDGWLDVVSASRADGRIAWFANLGGSSFGPPQSISSGVDYPGDPAIADLDGDGDLDVIASSPDRLEVLWYEALGGGAFSDEQVLLTVPSVVRGVAAGDLDGDGDQDVLVSGDFGVVWHANLGAVGFGPAQTLAAAPLVGNDVLAAELNGDGWLEVVVATGAGGPTPGASEVRVIFNRGGGSFFPPRIVGSALSVGELAVADVAGSSLRDVVFLGTWYDEVVYVENLGNGIFGPGVYLYAPGGVNSSTALGVGDLDGDGDFDVLSAGWGGVAWYEQQAGGLVLVGTHLGLDGTYGASVADLDGDGIGDVLAQGGDGIEWIPSLGGGAFGPSQKIPSDFLSGTTAIAADLDGNGSLDPVVTDYYAHSVSWFPNLMSADCDQNGILDAVEIATGAVADCDANGIPDPCDLLAPGADQDGDGQLDACMPPALAASETELSLSAGGTQTLALSAPSAGGTYLLMGTLSGTAPGTQFTGLQIPLNFDGYTHYTIQVPNQAPYTGSLGILEPGPSGATATAVITVPSSSSPGLAGLTLHHAFAVLQPGGLSFASNAVPLTLAP